MGSQWVDGHCWSPEPETLYSHSIVPGGLDVTS